MNNPRKAFEQVILALNQGCSSCEKRVSFNDNYDVDGYNVAILPGLRREVEKRIRGAGKIVDLVAYAPAKGGGWTVVLDTEYAALKLYYYYRMSDVHLTEKGSTWIISVN